jgi:CheY-like chemotaxis protein
LPKEDEFLALLKSALDHLYEYRALIDHPLARLYSPEGKPEAALRAERFNRLVLESIDALNPPEAPAVDSLHARAYRLLVLKYVEEWPLPEIMRELGVSRTQFFREQRKAIAVLATMIRDRLPVEALVTPDQRDSAATSSKPLRTDLSAEAERILGQHTQIDPVRMLKEVLRVLANLTEQRQVTISYTAAPELPRIYGGRTLVRQIYLEALSALISLPKTKRVEAHVAPGPEGILTELVTHTESIKPQTGVDVQGFDAVRRLVEIAGGRWHSTEITATGVICRFELPKAEPETVLVIDDNEGMIRVFESYLEPSGYRVIGCTVGNEALRLAKELEPAAITLDIMMPNQDGWEILLGLREEPATTGAPIIICSVLDDPQLAFSLGADAYLSKPITQEKLLATLGELVR